MNEVSAVLKEPVDQTYERLAAILRLDVSVQGELLNFLQDIRKSEEITLIVISHNLAIVRLIAESAAVMQRGQIVEQGDAGALFDNPQAQYTRELVASWPRMQTHA
jgi:peptide/nickel transport system ATP-binding protein